MIKFLKRFFKKSHKPAKKMVCEKIVLEKKFRKTPVKKQGKRK